MTAESKIRTIEPDITVVEISGRLALGNVLVSLEYSVRRLIEEGARKVIVDLTGLDNIDSAGIGVLVACSGLLEQSKGKLRIAGAHGSVAKVFDVVHMDRITALDADFETSCRHLAPGTASV
jgi:anti-sigma B factor antagonist